MDKTDGLRLRPIDIAIGLASIAVPLAMLTLTYALRSHGISLIVGVVNGLILVVAVWLFVATVSLWRKIPLPDDVTDTQYSTLKSIQPMVETLHDMGFDLLGILHMKLAVMPGLYEWVFISDDQSVIASVLVRGPKKFFVQFATVFDNNAVIHTEYPDSANTDLPTLRSTGIRTSPEAAYGYHLREMTAFAKQHGAIREFHALDDWRDWYRTFILLYGSHKLGGSLRRESLQLMGASMAVTGLIWGLIVVTRESVPIGALLLLMFLAGTTIVRNALSKGRDIQKHKPEETAMTDDSHLFTPEAAQSVEYVEMAEYNEHSHS